MRLYPHLSIASLSFFADPRLARVDGEAAKRKHGRPRMRGREQRLRQPRRCTDWRGIKRVMEWLLKLLQRLFR